ncbi:MAG: YbaK/EbsC family protein [Candidatus Hydrogenedentes bacterium]|nr:YbaK/EbsC family protein [Candidatus Hydrogenedentota bacterium]
MLASSLQKMLDENGIKYFTVRHNPAFTAQEVAATTHISGHRLAKTVVAKIDGSLALIVVPATHRVRMDAIKRLTGAHRVELAHEDDFKEAFPECELGAMPPFGNLYGMEVFVERDLAQNDTIAFNAGGHDEVMSMSYRDFERLAHPRPFGMLA